jgi:hypothetical protein
MDILLTAWRMQNIFSALFVKQIKEVVKSFSQCCGSWICIGFSADPNPALLIKADPVPYPDPGFDGQKFKKSIAEKSCFSIKTCNLSLGLQKGRPSYRKSLQPSKAKIQHFRT